VYGRHEPELRPIAERILREELGDEVVLTWMKGEARCPEAEAHYKEWKTEMEGGVVGYTDGSRMDGAAAGASAEGGLFLGDMATVMDAEMVGIAGAWEEGYKIVASDSQAATRRCINLTTGVQKGRSWIDEKVLRAAKWGRRRRVDFDMGEGA